MPIAIKSLVVAGAAALAALSPASSRVAGTQSNPHAQSQPVVLELFTSQGCSSCPPADRLAGTLAADRGFLVLSRPVTYWDRLGWKDTLARPQNTALQHAYAERNIDAQGGVYTPQMVVDGGAGAIGSDRAAIVRLARGATAHRSAALAAVRIKNGGYAIGIDGPADASAELVLIPLDAAAIVPIGSGENSGHSVTYTNVVLDELRIAQWSGGKSAQVIDPVALRTSGADRHAVILRQKNGGRILAGVLLSAA